MQPARRRSFAAAAAAPAPTPQPLRAAEAAPAAADPGPTPVPHPQLLRCALTLLAPTCPPTRVSPLVPGHSGLAPFAVSTPGGDFFVKISNAPARTAALDHERRWAAAAARLGLSPAPRPLASKAPATPWALCTALLDAETLQNAQLEQPALLRALLHSVRTWHEGAPEGVEATAAKGPRRRLDDALVRAQRRGSMTQPSAAALQRLGHAAVAKLEDLAPAPTPVHGDFQRRNVLVGANLRVWLIDLADAGYGEPMTDLAHCALDSSVPMASMAAWAEVYQQDRPHDPTLWPRLQLALFCYRATRLAEFSFWSPHQPVVADYERWVARDFAALAPALQRPLAGAFAAWQDSLRRDQAASAGPPA